DSSRLTRPPERGLSRPRLVRTHPPCHRCWFSYVRGYPCPGLVSTLLNHTYSTPDRLVHACLHVTEQVWQPMHLARFMTMGIYAITFMSVLDLLCPATDHRDLVALVTGGTQIVEGERQLGVSADEVCRLDEQSGERVVDAAAPSGRLGDRHVHHPFLRVVHV